MDNHGLNGHASISTAQGKLPRGSKAVRSRAGCIPQGDLNTSQPRIGYRQIDGSLLLLQCSDNSVHFGDYH